jgi:hypothetical protein
MSLAFGAYLLFGVDVDMLLARWFDVGGLKAFPGQDL